MRRAAARRACACTPATTSTIAELIGGDATGYRDALLGIFDAIAPAASAALPALDAGDRERYDAILAPTVPLSRHIFARADALLQDGHRLPGLAQRPPVALPMVGGQESARSVLHLAELFRLADAAGLLRDPELAARADARRARAAGLVTDAARLGHDAPLRSSLNTATVRAQWTLPAIIDGCAAARHSRHLAVARPGRRGGLEQRRARIARRRARVSGLLPRRDVSRGRPRGRRARASTTTGAPSTRRATLGAPCLVLVVGGLPQDRDGRIASQGHRRRARDGARRHRRAARVRARRAACRSRSSRCIRCTPPTARASTRWRRRMRLCDELGDAGVGMAVDVYHVWWDPRPAGADRARRRARRPRLSHLRLAGADHGSAASTAA